MKINWLTARRGLGLALVVAALAVAGCGGGSSSSASSASSPPAASSSTSGGSSSSGIPQGANAGDKDADNQGGPSDGDGNI